MTTVTITSPSAVNLTAFPTRFTRICRSLVTSPITVAGIGIIQLVSEVQFLFGGLGRQKFEGLLDTGPQIERMLFKIQLARLDLREIQDVVDDRHQGVGGAVNGFDVVALFVGQLRVQQQSGHAGDAIHGRADFVAHIGDELRLGARGFLETLIQRNQGRVAGQQLLLAFPQSAKGVVALESGSCRPWNDSGCGRSIRSCPAASPDSHLRPPRRPGS